MAIESFEVTKGARSGDMLSTRTGQKRLKVGLLATAYFEYYRMYENIKREVTEDMQVVVDRLKKKHDIVYPGLVDTLDSAEQAGILFAKEQVDLIIVTEATYTTDYILHQALHHLSGDIPILIYASQVHDRLDFNASYDQALRNSGPMGLVQLTAGFRKMNKFSRYHIVTGAINDDEAYREIDQFIGIHTTIAELRGWVIGVIGHVFRGMYDFQYDKTALQGVFGPHVMELQSSHLVDIWKEHSLADKKVVALKNRVFKDYDVKDLSEEEVLRAARLAVSLTELVDRYKLDGLALLGQHYIEKLCNSTCHLGVSEILLSDKAFAVTEGDVIGAIMCKVLKDFTGQTPFFGEWEEFDLSLNAAMLLGHGFVDPRTTREKRPPVRPTCEQWGFEGKSFGFQASFKPGPVTMTHVIQDPKGWRILITGGQILETPPFTRLGECAMVIGVEKPVKQFFKELMKFGFAHHAIVGYGDVRYQLEIFAEQLDLEVCRI